MTTTRLVALLGIVCLGSGCAKKGEATHEAEKISGSESPAPAAAGPGTTGTASAATATSGATVAGTASAGATLEARACARIEKLRAKGCRAFQKTAASREACEADLRKAHSAEPKSKWIAQCLVDHETCAAVTSCLEGPPVDRSTPSKLDGLIKPPPPPPR